MKIAISAPVNVGKRVEVLGISESEFYSNVDKVISALSGKEIVIVPHKGSLSEYVACKHTGKVIGVVPKNDTEFGIDFLNSSVCTEVLDCGTWRNQIEAMLDVSDVLVVMGLGCGSMAELCFTKWFKVKKIFVVDEFISSKIPKEIDEELDIEYISVDELMLG
ncbi:hypothetical protein HN419_02945 [Candidatus Woesearchaeota archaeon]|nr:hypothetical protein [Candidatus Woesearchaeota archaeon]MBT3537045.1 hypothetical protein [Candidatus Woesearchaeota archaeon]MBT4697655.1 hypothetical protein [Candidatus Woesearchaeota archaeon]MBT4716965.1 hypothetical protein [Candidatus Woesearchaeota archaeon]MBT7106645.1 hypothetical protein [Candidatus Woesearchaeota archaeon]